MSLERILNESYLIKSYLRHQTKNTHRHSDLKNQKFRLCDVTSLKIILSEIKFIFRGFKYKIFLRQLKKTPILPCPVYPGVTHLLYPRIP